MIPWKKQRTKLGEWMDRKKVTQEWLREKTGLNKSTVSELCSNEDYRPHNTTRSAVIKALRQVDPAVSALEFW